MIWLNGELEQLEGASTPDSSSQLSQSSEYSYTSDPSTQIGKTDFFLPCVLLSFLLQQ